MTIWHCVPVKALWDLTITNARCDNGNKKFMFGSILVHIFIDFAILSLPIFEILKLQQLREIERLGVVALFVFGIL
jgi:hypothetical protein